VFRSDRRPFPTFGRRPFCSNFWQETVLFQLLAGDRFVPSFGRGPFCSIFWQGTVLFHLLAGDRFVPSFGRGPFVPSFGRGPFCTFLSGAPNVVLDISSRRHHTRQWSRTRLRRCRHSQTAASCAWLRSQHARLAPLRAMCRSAMPKRGLHCVHEDAVKTLRSRSDACIASMKTLRCHCEAEARPLLLA